MIAVWADAEFWGARGLGCGHCIDEPPVTSFAWGSLGFQCVARWFPGRKDACMLGWFERQHKVYSTSKKRKKQKGQQMALRGLAA